MSVRELVIEKLSSNEKCTVLEISDVIKPLFNHLNSLRLAQLVAVILNDLTADGAVQKTARRGQYAYVYSISPTDNVNWWAS